MLAGILVAIVSVWSVKSTAKKKQTADFLFAIRSDERLITAIHTLRDLHDSDQNMRLLAGKQHTKEENVQQIRYLLNHFERLSVGVQEDIYNEKMLRKSQYTIITKTYDWAKPFIEGVREQTRSPTAFQEFECLAKQWKAAPLKKRKGSD